MVVVVMVMGVRGPPPAFLLSPRFGLFSFEGHEVGDGEGGVRGCHRVD